MPITLIGSPPITQATGTAPHIEITVNDVTYSTVTGNLLPTGDFSIASATNDVGVADGAQFALFNASADVIKYGDICQIFLCYGTARTLYLDGKVTSPIRWVERTRTLEFAVESIFKDKVIDELDFADEIIYPMVPLVFGEVIGLPITPYDANRQAQTLTTIYSRVLVDNEGGKVVYSSGNFRVKNAHRFPQSTVIVLEIDNTLFSGTFTPGSDEFDVGVSGFNVCYNTVAGSPVGVDIHTRYRFPDGDTPAQTDPYSDGDEYNPNVFWIGESTGRYTGKFLRIRFTRKGYVLNDTYACSEYEGVLKTEDMELHATLSEQWGTRAVLDQTPFTEYREPFLLGANNAVGNASILEVKGKCDYDWTDAPMYNYPSSWEIAPGADVKLYSYTGWKYYINKYDVAEGYVVHGMQRSSKVLVPSSYYTIGTDEKGTYLYFTLKLTQYRSDGWDSDDIYVSMRSLWDTDLTDNAADVIKRLVDDYLDDITVDTTSFNAVVAADFVTKYPVGFAVRDRLGVMSVIKDIAWQSRIGVFFYGSYLYMKELAKAPTTGYTITAGQTEWASLEYELSDKTDIYTQFRFSWRETYFPDETENIVYRKNNEDKFGSMLFTSVVSIYNHLTCITALADFWVDRYSNTWEISTVRNFMSSVALLPFDDIIIDIDYLTATKGRVISRVFSSSEMSVGLKVWGDYSPSGGTPWWDYSTAVKPSSVLSTLASNQYLNKFGRTNYPIKRGLRGDHAFKKRPIKDDEPTLNDFTNLVQDVNITAVDETTGMCTGTVVDPVDTAQPKDWAIGSPHDMPIEDLVPADRVPPATVFFKAASLEEMPEINSKAQIINRPSGVGSVAGVPVVWHQLSTPGAGSKSYLCKITGVTNGLYDVDLYVTLLGEKVGTAKMQLAKIHPSEQLAIGDWCVGTRSSLIQMEMIDDPNP